MEGESFNVTHVVMFSSEGFYGVTTYIQTPCNDTGINHALVTGRENKRSTREREREAKHKLLDRGL